AAAAERSVFKRSHRGGADSDNPALPNKRTVDLLSRRRRDGEIFAMNPVLFNNIGAHGLKRTQSHVQRDFRNLDSRAANFAENFLSKVKASSGSGGAASGVAPGVDILIALAVFVAIRAIDVGRQWHMAQ